MYQEEKGQSWAEYVKYNKGFLFPSSYWSHFHGSWDRLNNNLGAEHY